MDVFCGSDICDGVDALMRDGFVWREAVMLFAALKFGPRSCGQLLIRIREKVKIKPSNALGAFDSLELEKLVRVDRNKKPYKYNANIRDVLEFIDKRILDASDGRYWLSAHFQAGHPVGIDVAVRCNLVDLASNKIAKAR
jgi:hypothetical protein